MAYNPFNVFRRNQKVIFAILTVFIMFMFVLSSGLGGGADFFEWLPQWLGTKARKGDHLATIDGTRVYSGDLDKLYRDRLISNQYMTLASVETQDYLGRLVRNLEPRMSNEGLKVMEQIRQSELSLIRLASDPQLAGFAQQWIAQTQLNNMEMLQRLATSQTASPEDKEVARAQILSTELARRRSAGGGELYFSNAQNRTQRDQLEFLLWEKKADQLGISFTEADVKKLIQKEFMSMFVSDVNVREAMSKRGQGGFSMEACLRAIGTEFKVRAAQTALLGPVADRADRTTTAFPLYSPPFEQFQYFRDNASPTTYRVLAVPAAAFTGEVSGTPTNEELRKLFDQHSTQEPNPANKQPGFKQSRQIKAEWLSARGDEPYYKQTAAEQLGKSQAANILGMALGHPLAATAFGPLATSEPLLDHSYKTITEARHRRALFEDWGFTLISPRPLDTSVVRPENLAAAAGAAAGALSSFGMNFPAAQTLRNRVWAAEQRDRIAVGIPSFLGAVPGPGLFATIMAGEARSQLAVPKALDMAVVRPQLQKELAEREARKIMTEDLERLRVELTKPDMLKASNKSDAQKMIADFAAKRGLPTGRSTELKDEWTIGDDPGLAPVKEALEKTEGGNNPHRGVSAPIQFGRQFFWTDTRTGRTATRDTYKPEFYPDPRPDSPDASPFAPPEPRFLVWRTEDKPATTLAFEVAKPKVIEAWKRIKARELAKTRAEDIAALVRKETIPFETAIQQDLEKQKAELQAKTTDPKVKDKVKEFELAGVSPIAPLDSLAAGGRAGSVQPFRLTPTTNIPYPTPEMQKALIDERAKPVKTALVLTDAPEDTYYVAVVAAKSEKTEAAFKQDVFSDSQVAASRNLVINSLQVDSFRKARDSVMTLLKREFKYVEDDAQKEKLDENAKKGGES